MAHIEVEASVRTHRKFIKAGPAPSWLWLCGLGYCQDALTDGFISEEALPFLGVKNAKQLAGHLERAGLWERVDGGWQVHDYLKHNRSAAEVADLKARRKRGGAQGGRPPKTTDETLEVSYLQTSEVTHSKTSVKTFPEKSRDEQSSVALSRVGVSSSGAPLDRWWFDALAKYPEGRRTRSARAEQAFCAAMTGHREGPFVAWGLFCANLEANIQSHEWRVKGMVPSLEKYITEGRWQDRLPESAPVAEIVSARTARMLGGA